MEKTLLVDDENDILEFLSYNLSKEGFQVLTCNNGKEAIQIAQKENPDLIILDVMMPEMDGIETCKQIRNINQFKNTLVIFLSARGEDYSQLAGFEAGADDYIPKPIKPAILINKVKALLRIKTIYEPLKSNFIGITVNREKFLVVKNNKEFILPKKEFELLYLLVNNPNKTYTRNEIYKQVWDNLDNFNPKIIDVQVRKIREKIGESLINTVNGVGYQLAIS